MSRDDERLLNEIVAALNDAPFSQTVRIHGVFMSRHTARALERQMLRLRVAERRAA